MGRAMSWMSTRYTKQNTQNENNREKSLCEAEYDQQQQKVTNIMQFSFLSEQIKFIASQLSDWMINLQSLHFKTHKTLMLLLFFRLNFAWNWLKLY